MIGSAIAADLCIENDVTVADKDTERLKLLKSIYSVKIQSVDVQQTDMAEFLKEFDLVICAVPGHMGFDTLKEIISAGKDVVDISFFDRDPFELDDLARKMNVTAIVDCGVSPGMSNIILGFHNESMNIERYECYVGGLPFKKEKPY